MITNRGLLRTRVSNSFLRFLDKKLNIPIAKFDVSFELNNIPVATITPALGRSISTGNQALLSQVAEEDRVEVVVVINGNERVMLAGYVTTISGSDNSTLFNRTLSAQIKVTHNALSLAGAQSMSALYTQKGQVPLISLMQLRTGTKLFAPGGGNSTSDDSSVEPFGAFVTELSQTTGLDIALYPSDLLKEVNKRVMLEYRPLITEDQLDELVKSFPQCNLLTVVPDATTYLNSVLGKYKQGWTTSNAWDALVATCRYLYMAVIPYNKGFYIANPCAYVRDPAVSLRSAEYLSIAQSKTDEDLVPVDGVVISVPATTLIPEDAFKVAYPVPLEGLQEAQSGKYYAFRELPDWVHPINNYMYGGARGNPITPTNRGDVDKEEFEADSVGASNISDYYRQIGVRLAKLIYSTMRSEGTAVAITLPYREDLMPGTRIQLENSGAEDMSFIGDTLHGMIVKTSVVGDMLSEHGKLNTIIHITGIRNQIDNNNDNVTFKDHPVYEKVWTSINIDGEFTVEPEAATKRKPAVNTAVHSSITGIVR